MSKYLGKLLYKSGAVPEAELKCVTARYVESTHRFVIGHVSVSEAFLYELVAFDVGGLPDAFYQWSYGYSVREKKKDLDEVRKLELEMLGGRRSLLINGDINSDYDFEYLCVVMYLFKFCKSVLDNVKKQWKRKKWGRTKSRELVLERKSEQFLRGGRVVGSKGSKPNSDDEASLEFELGRISHNKSVALSRGVFWMWEEACKEECKVLGKKFDKDLCLKMWESMKGEKKGTD